MRKVVLLLSLAIFVACSRKVTVVENSVAGYYNYESTIVEVGVQGTSVIKAWGTGKTVEKAKEDAKRNAVYSVLFKGFPSTANVNSTDLRPMITEANAEQKYNDYFTKFFADGGKYLQYVQFTDKKGELGLGDAVKKDGMFKIGVVVVVDKSGLRKEMESAGIVRKFGIN